jgi:hypothetical protein
MEETETILIERAIQTARARLNRLEELRDVFSSEAYRLELPPPPEFPPPQQLPLPLQTIRSRS